MATEEQMPCETVLSLERVQVYTLHDHLRSFVVEGDLSVLSSSLEGSEHVILMVGDKFQYALGKSVPVMRVSQRNYVFPSDAQFFGIVLDIATTVHEIEVFDSILEQYSTLRVSRIGDKSLPIDEMEEKPPEDDRVAEAGNSMAKYISRGSLKLSAGIAAAAVIGGKGIATGGTFLRTKIKPKDEPTKVSDKTKARLQQAKMVSGVVVNVSKAMVVGAVAAAGALSNSVSDAVEKTEMGKKFTTESTPRTDAAKNVVKSSVCGAMEIVVALEQAGLDLLKATTDTTSDVLGHRYGDEVKAASQDAGSVALALGQSKVAMSKVGLRAITTRAAREAAVDLVSSESDRSNRRAQQPGIDPAMGAGLAIAASQMARGYDDATAESGRKSQK
eukprot:186000_1